MTFLYSPKSKAKLRPNETFATQASPGRPVVIPNRFKKLVSGPGGDHLRSVSTMTGAEVSSVGPNNRVYVTGANKSRQHAEFMLRSRVVSFTQAMFYVIVGHK